jgi:hypothetical protein
MSKLVKATKGYLPVVAQGCGQVLDRSEAGRGMPNPLSQCWRKIGFPTHGYRLENRDVRQLLWRRHRTNADASHEPAAGLAMNEEGRYKLWIKQGRTHWNMGIDPGRPDLLLELGVQFRLKGSFSNPEVRRVRVFPRLVR